MIASDFLSSWLAGYLLTFDVAPMRRITSSIIDRSVESEDVYARPTRECVTMAKSVREQESVDYGQSKKERNGDK